MKIETMLVGGAVMALGVLAASSCGGAKEDPPADAPAPTAKGEAKAAEVIARPSTKEATAPRVKTNPLAAAGGDVPTIGVPECDDYVAKMNACFASDVIPEHARDQQKLAFDAAVRGWADAVTVNPEGGGVLVAGCKAAHDMAKMAYPRCFEGG